MEVIEKVENTPQTQTPQGEGDKLIEYIKELEELKLDYDTKYITDNIQYSYKISDSVKKALLEVYNVLANYVNNAKTRGKMLREAYTNKSARGMLTNAIEIYADLKAINALRKFINSYNIQTEPDFMATTFIDFSEKAKETLIIVINRYVKNDVSEQSKKKLFDKIISELNEVTHTGSLKKGFNKYKEEFEENEDIEKITVGEYKVLQKALQLIRYYYTHGLRFVKNIRAMVNITNKTNKNNMKKITWKLAEAYAITSIPDAFFDVLCSNKYGICFNRYGIALHAMTAIEWIEDYALVR
ncbi:hypothetical protein [Saccharolobus sp.]|uniref:hypothetical protein n=1 Tax=Saccharolobus sp. TaxID=2100761 RepID=UPI0031781043